MVKVSIIMPVYKAAHFIENSISSFENQTLSDFELILVNDCSPDSSLQIIKRYAEKKSNIRIVDLKENCGPMYARFEGCEIAQGEYITFCDSDDNLPNDALEIMYAKAVQTNADIVSGTIDFIQLSDGSHSLWKSSLKYGSDQNATMKSLLKNEYRHNIVGKLIKRELLQNYKYSNVKGLRYFEDFVLMYEMVNNVKNFVCIDDVVYNYIQTEGSSTMLGMSDTRLDNIIYAHSLIFQLISEKHASLMKYCYANYQKRFISLLFRGHVNKKSFMRCLEKYHLEEVLSLHRIFESNNIVDSVKLALVLLFSPILSKKKV